jgi:hypothetical protein
MGKQLLLEHVNVPGIEKLDVYRAHGGYKALEKALRMKTDERGLPDRNEMEFPRKAGRRSASFGV